MASEFLGSRSAPSEIDDLSSGGAAALKILDIDQGHGDRASGWRRRLDPRRHSPAAPRSAAGSRQALSPKSPAIRGCQDCAPSFGARTAPARPAPNSRRLQARGAAPRQYRACTTSRSGRSSSP